MTELNLDQIPAANGKGRLTPVAILTGFLGSGKTTLLNQLLRDPTMVRTAVVINEFGDISIDHALTADSNDSILVLENGCLCCTVFGDLLQTLNRLYHSRADGSIAFDRVAIETSGLADLPTIIQAFLSDPTLRGLYRVNTMIATVDAVNGPSTLAEHSVAVRQIALADHILITKLDLISDDNRQATRESLRRHLRRINRTAMIHDVGDALSMDPAQLIRHPGLDPTHSPQAAKIWVELGQTEDADHEEGHTHIHDSSISSFSLVRDAPIPREALNLLLACLESQLGPSLLRVKGLVHVAEEPDRPAIIQGAQHLLHNLTWLRQWPDADRRTRIVFITQGIASAELRETVQLLDRVAQRTAAARQRAAEHAEGPDR
jgi:G3E family GTPase